MNMFSQIVNIQLLKAWRGFCQHIFLSLRCMPSDHRGQKKVSYPLAVKLLMGVSHHVGTGN